MSQAPTITRRKAEDVYPEILKRHALWLNTGGRSGIQANFAGANLRDLDFRATRLERAILIGSDLRGSILDGMNLIGADFTRSRLEETSFRGANLLRAKLDGAWVNGTDFTGASLISASFDPVEFRSAILINTVLPLAQVATLEQRTIPVFVDLASPVIESPAL